MFCPKCGAQMEENAQFCTRCGAQRTGGSAEPGQLGAVPVGMPTGAPVKKKKKWPIVLGVVGGLFLLLILLGAFSGGDASDSRSKPDTTDKNPPQTDTQEERSSAEDSSEPADATTEPAVEDASAGGRVLIGETQTFLGHMYGDKYNEFEITLDYVEFVDIWEGDGLLGAYEEEPESGNKFLCVGITAKNIGKQEGTLKRPKLLYDWEYEFETSDSKGTRIADVPPLSAPQTEVYAFEIPTSVVESDKPLALQFIDDYEETIAYFMIREGASGDAAGQEEWQVAEGDYTNYLSWCGEYDGGWMDTTLSFQLYTDGTQNPECGFAYQNFRGNEWKGNLYYLGENEFQWDLNDFGGQEVYTYYIFCIEANGVYQLEIRSLGEDPVIFTQYMQYEF